MITVTDTDHNRFVDAYNSSDFCPQANFCRFSWTLVLRCEKFQFIVKINSVCEKPRCGERRFDVVKVCEKSRLQSVAVSRQILSNVKST